MEKTILSFKDVEMVLESLKYTKMNFENCQYYPSYEYKQDRIKQVEEVITNVRALRDALKVPKIKRVNLPS